MGSELVDDLKNDKAYRDAYVAAHVRNGIAFQIRAMRNARGWDQKQLAMELGNAKLQPVVSRYENPDYGRFSVSTLLDLAKAFDVGLIVRFAPFNEVIDWESKFEANGLDVTAFDPECAPFTSKEGTASVLIDSWIESGPSITNFPTAKSECPYGHFGYLSTASSSFPMFEFQSNEGTELWRNQAHINEAQPLSR